MIPEPTALELVDLGFGQVIGLRAWDPSIGVGSFLTIEFGSPRVTSAGVTQGAFHLWIYGSSWSIRKRGNNIATSEQDHATMATGAHVLDDALVQGFEFDPDQMTLTLRLDSDLELIVRPSEDPDMEEWLLYLNDGTVITAGPGMGVVRESAAASHVQPSE